MLVLVIAGIELNIQKSLWWRVTKLLYLKSYHGSK